MAKPKVVDGVREDDKVVTDNDLASLLSEDELNSLIGGGNISGVKDEEPITEGVTEEEEEDDVEDEDTEDPRFDQIAQILEKLSNAQTKEKEPVVEKVEKVEFPRPPQPPKRPAGYSREEASTDPKSSSAKYENDYAEYQDQYSQWQTLHNMYLTKRIEEMEEAASEREKTLREEIRNLDARRNSESEALKFAKKNGLNAELSEEFIDMVKDFKVTPDLLMEYFRLKKGLGSRRVGQSKAFVQRKNAERSGSGSVGRSSSPSATPTEAIFGLMKEMDKANKPF